HSKKIYLISFAEVKRGRNAAWVLNSEQTIKPECIKPPFQVFLTYVTALEYWKDIFPALTAVPVQPVPRNLYNCHLITPYQDCFDPAASTASIYLVIVRKAVNG
ncbi:hypothetical protein LRN34_23595, partial [Enterobacter kobei]|uniref:hypothetical protein n=1 Tax=Enterobacter kobei TaxID=208224 RepID=UPI001E641057